MNLYWSIFFKAKLTATQLIINGTTYVVQRHTNGLHGQHTKHVSHFLICATLMIQEINDQLFIHKCPSTHK